MARNGSCAPYDLSFFNKRSSSLFAALCCHHSRSVSHMTPGVRSSAELGRFECAQKQVVPKPKLRELQSTNVVYLLGIFADRQLRSRTPPLVPAWSVISSWLQKERSFGISHSARRVEGGGCSCMPIADVLVTFAAATLGCAVSVLALD